MSSARLKWCWLGLVLLRFIWTCLPQAGYIHPDEFFQSIEVAAGDILGIDALRTWEFNSTFPLRSIIPIYISTGVPLLLLKAVSGFCGHVISWYSVTVTVRLGVTLMSLVTDLTAMRLAGWLGSDAGTAAVVMATSYVSLVYFTRTFSNTLEAFLFAVLLHLISKSSRKKRELPCTELIQTVCISTVIVIGVFNRPTFVVYAAVPYLWYLFSNDVHRVVPKALNSILAAVPVAAVMVISDSVYFGRLCLNDINIVDALDLWKFVTCNFTVTPLNFVLYNMQADNLAEHGIHPRFTHFLVNLPLLFSVLGVYFLYTVCTIAVKTVVRKSIFASRQWKVLVLSCMVPVGLLSIFPHQEPRFLIPLLPVLAAMFARQVIASRWWWVALWVISNLAGGLIYGSVHQAGIVPCLGYLQQNRPTTAGRLVIFWHTYSAPQHLLLVPQQSFQTSDLAHGHTSLKSLHGNSVGKLVDNLLQINSSSSSFSRSGEKPEVMVAASSSEHYHLVCSAVEAGIRLHLDKSFWPHLSMEHPPRWTDLTCQKSAEDTCLNDGASTECSKTLMERIKFFTSLNLYKVTYS